MGLTPSGQLDISKKNRPRRGRHPIAPPRRTRIGKLHQEGLEWQRKMRTLALKLPKGRARRSRSGTPMKKG
jgi:hypothetical protein